MSWFLQLYILCSSPSKKTLCYCPNCRLILNTKLRDKKEGSGRDLKLEGIFLCPLIIAVGDFTGWLISTPFIENAISRNRFCFTKIRLFENVALSNLMNSSYIVTVMTVEICSNITYGNRYTFSDIVINPFLADKSAAEMVLPCLVLCYAFACRLYLQMRSEVTEVISEKELSCFVLVEY